MTTDLETFKRERNQALLSFDLEWMRQHMRSETGRVPDDKTLLLVAHKLRYECTELPRAARMKSATYLRQNGYTRWTGGPLLAHGELPQ